MRTCNLVFTSPRAGVRLPICLVPPVNRLGFRGLVHRVQADFRLLSRSTTCNPACGGESMAPPGTTGDGTFPSFFLSFFFFLVSFFLLFFLY